LLITTLLVAGFFMPGKKTGSASGFGLDFIAFYRAGSLVHTGHADRLYDLKDTQTFDQSLAKSQNLDLGNGYGAFLNPPFFAWLFVPFAVMNYSTGLGAWLALNICCFAGAAILLSRVIPLRYDPDPNLEPFRDWRDWALVPALMAVSFPCLQNIFHAQNTFISVLLMTCAVIAWRDGRAFLGGIAIGLLCYKPQLASAILAAMVLTLGWRTLAGAAISIGSLLAINLLTLPGTFPTFLHQVAPNVQYYLSTHPHVWISHATFNGFWHVLFGQYFPAGLPVARYVAIGCSAPIAVALLACIWRNRKSTSRDRIISAVITSAPLVMPYYLDYDLLLLAIPAILLASEVLSRDPAQPMPKRDAWLIRLWAALYLLLLVNPGLTGILHVNIGTILLTAIAGLSIARAISPSSSVDSASDAGNSFDSFQRPIAA
jgi:hypothetical protein